ncbi:MAG TPA: diguanylate cyclase [Polyangia bacterium]|nr:diguanylate cyclase [Polyangia bacterium]
MASHNILYVDDEAENLATFARVFHDADFVAQVFTAQSAEEGLKVLGQHPIAAVISDQRMPGTTGTDFLARVVRDFPRVVRLILTAYTDVHEIIEAVNQGHIYAFLTKPWEPEELKMTVRRALEHYEVAFELERKNRELEVAMAGLELAHRDQVRLFESIITDDKTGVRNYHYFRFRLGEEFERAKRYGKDLALVMIDVDDFRAVDDTLGRPAAERVLRELAQLLAHGQRAVDVVARYGGEEFALVLPETGLAGARVIAERLRAQVAARTFQPGGKPLRLSISAGVAAFPHGEVATKEQLIQRADQALYRAKAHGKNRVESDR